MPVHQQSRRSGRQLGHATTRTEVGQTCGRRPRGAAIACHGYFTAIVGCQDDVRTIHHLRRQDFQPVRTTSEVVTDRRPSGPVLVAHPHTTERRTGIDAPRCGGRTLHAMHAPGLVLRTNLGPARRHHGRARGPRAPALFLTRLVAALDGLPIHALGRLVQRRDPTLARILVVALCPFVLAMLGGLRNGARFSGSRRRLLAAGPQQRGNTQQGRDERTGEAHSLSLAQRWNYRPEPNGSSVRVVSEGPSSASKISNTSKAAHWQGTPHSSVTEGRVMPPSPLTASLT